MTTAGEEAAAIAQEFIVSLDNVPSEVQFLLAEMRERECRITELQARIQPRSAQYLRHAGKGMLSDKDQQSFDRINADYEVIKTLSEEKVQMAKKLHNLLVKHANRLQVELAKITSPGEPIMRAVYPVATIASTGYSATAGSVAGANGTTPSESLVYSGANRTPIAGVVQALKVDANASSTPVASAATPSAPVPIVLEPASNTVSAAPSPSSAPANKRRKLNTSQSSASIQPTAAPATPSAGTPRSSAPRPSSTTATLAPAAPAAPETPGSSRPRRAASANVSPAPNPAASRNMSETTSMSTTTTGGDDKDDEMVDARSSTGEGDGDADGDDGPYCVCQEKSYGEMIGCDNGSDCPYQWFHVACVHVQKPLPATWFCDYCTKKLGFADNTGAPASGSERPARKRRR